MRLRLKALPEPPDRALLRTHDWLGALGVFLLVFLSTFPVVIPFIFMKDVTLALRVSNAIAIVLLFLTGHSFGRSIGRHPVRTGIAMVVLGRRPRRPDDRAGRMNVSRARAWLAAVGASRPWRATARSPRSPRSPPYPGGATAAKAWAFDASAYTYFVPDANDFVSPVVKADRGWLHLEARYNYEGFRTGSIWFGYNFSAGEKLVLDFTVDGGSRPGRHRRRRAGLPVLARLREARALERKRVRLRQPRFGRQLLLQLVGAELRAGGVDPRRRRRAEDEALRRGSRRPARRPRRVLVQEGLGARPTSSTRTRTSPRSFSRSAWASDAARVPGRHGSSTAAQVLSGS